MSEQGNNEQDKSGDNDPKGSGESKDKLGDAAESSITKSDAKKACDSDNTGEDNRETPSVFDDTDTASNVSPSYSSPSPSKKGTNTGFSFSPSPVPQDQASTSPASPSQGLSFGSNITSGTRGFGSSASGTQGFGSNRTSGTQGFGSGTSGFGSGASGFGSNRTSGTQGFGSGTSGFGSNATSGTQGFGSSTSGTQGFGSPAAQGPAQGFFGTPAGASPSGNTTGQGFGSRPGLFSTPNTKHSITQQLNDSNNSGSKWEPHPIQTAGNSRPIRIHTITAYENKDKSVEELRWEHHQKGSGSDVEDNDSTQTPQWNSQAKSKPRDLIIDLKDLLQDELFADVTFVVDGKEIRAHKSILASRCDRFRTMFQSEFAEGGDNPTIEVKDVLYEVFSALLNYCYTDKVDFPELIRAVMKQYESKMSDGEEEEEEDETEETEEQYKHLVKWHGLPVIRLLQLSDEYMLSALKAECELELQQHHVKGPFSVVLLSLSEKYQCVGLKHTVMSYIAQNFSSFKDDLDFRALPKTLLIDFCEHACVQSAWHNNNPAKNQWPVFGRFPPLGNATPFGTATTTPFGTTTTTPFGTTTTTPFGTTTTTPFGTATAPRNPWIAPSTPSSFGNRSTSNFQWGARQ
eukprot:TRINITY_DN506_c0_g1_i1.p1 TRINITY_DN506_c0_g1~~TRINITY_DN506_c0_g1_i1.p1  ORF type:complete len:630 (-),score=126.05 TRINITY_DN506_c0_g1_i1:47-1936(-)